MKKIVLAILVIIMGVRIIADSGTFASKYSIIKLAEQDEESKKEKEKEENKHNKRYNEDICYIDAELNSSTQVTANPTSSLSNQKPYCGFTDKPNTPPPDLI